MSSSFESTQTTPFNSFNLYKKSQETRTVQPKLATITQGIQGFTDNNEARYWSIRFGLGKSTFDVVKRPSRNRALTLQPSLGGTAMAHQVLFGPSAFTKKKNRPPLAVVSGPRVALYGLSPTSSFSMELDKQTNAPNYSATKTIQKRQSQIEPDRYIQTGGRLALCAAFRNDGRLIAVGTDEGNIKICDVTVRATLTTFSTPITKVPIRTVAWFRNGQYVFGAGDDGQARIWNLSALSGDQNKPLVTLIGHGDSIRCATLYKRPKLAANIKSKNSNNATASTTTTWQQLAITGSYDHSIRIWNVDNLENQNDYVDRCIGILDHGAPVEALCVLPRIEYNEADDIPFWLLSAGGTEIKVWNVMTGECVCTILSQHRKTITSLMAVKRYIIDTYGEKTEWTRILSSSLEGVLQFHSWDAKLGKMEHLYTTKIPSTSSTTPGDASAVSVVMDEDGDRLAIGTASGKVLFRMRGLVDDEPLSQSKKQKLRAGAKRPPRAGTVAFFHRGRNADVGEQDYQVESKRKRQRFQDFDVAMRQFRYSDALDLALETRRPQDVIGVLEELGKRQEGLTNALSNRNEVTLMPLLSFTARYIDRPRFTSVLIGVSHKLIDIYQDVAGQSESIDELFDKLRNQVHRECCAQKHLLRIVGQLDAVMAEITET